MPDISSLWPDTAADLERVARRFYERFQAEHAALLPFLQGITDEAARARCAWRLLNRLMFRRFLQHKGWLAGDADYLFEAPQIEKDHPALEIPAEARQRLAAFFDEYRWRLDERPPRDDHEITPDVLGYVFEQSINQKQMGAYYTKEDVTGYICKHTIIPALFEKAQAQCHAAFQPDGAVWRLLRDNPDRYCYAPALKGLDLPLSPEIAAGINAISRRAGWDRPADPAYALPTETWREVIARRARGQQLRAALAAGTITSINDLITYNLDIQRFAQDVIERCQELELLRAFWQALEQITILDPTCGSGAFLIAALRVLEPLYSACLERMQAFVHGDRPVASASPPTEAGGVPPVSRPAGAGLEDFRDVLMRVAHHPNCRCAILQSIITRNLYGVDIMPEAVEVARLRLFLTLAARREDAAQDEPLPRLDLHLRVGNALIGYTTDEEAGRTVTGTADQLDRSLAAKYGIDPADTDAFTRWRASHQPFHWCIEFDEMVHQRGGFDVILGNPPYVEYAEGTFPYQLPPYRTRACGNLYPCIVERSRTLLHQQGRFGMILPLAAFATRNMIPLIEGVREWFPQSWLSFYHFRPSMLFSGGKVASLPTAIVLAKAQGAPQRFSTSVLKWHTAQRDLLFPTLAYQAITAPPDAENRHYYPKFGAPIENDIMQKLLRHHPVGKYLARTPGANSMYYRSAGGLYWKVFINFPWPYQTTSNKQCTFESEYDRDVFVALFNSSLFWWYYTVTFDTFNLKDYLLFGFRCTYPKDAALLAQLKDCTRRLMDDYRANAEHLKRGATGSYTIYARKSRPIIDEIDRLLGQHYGFTAEELDFILHYDRKYRMGQEAFGE